MAALAWLGHIVVDWGFGDGLRTADRWRRRGRQGPARVTSTGHLGSSEAIDGALATGMVKGALETWDRLAALLAGG